MLEASRGYSVVRLTTCFWLPTSFLPSSTIYRQSPPVLPLHSLLLCVELPLPFNRRDNQVFKADLVVITL